jgi:hypothetical protein
MPLGIAALLMADDRDLRAAVLREAGDDGVIVGEAAIAVEFVEAGEKALDVVERVGPGGMPRHQDALPRRQVLEQLRPNLAGALPQRFDRPLALRCLREHAQGLDFLEQHADRLFEFQQFRH